MEMVTWSHDGYFIRPQFFRQGAAHDFSPDVRGSIKVIFSILPPGGNQLVEIHLDGLVFSYI